MNLKARFGERVDWIHVVEGGVQCRFLCERDHEL